MARNDFEFRPYSGVDAAAIAEIYAHYVRTSVATFDFEAPSLAATREKYDAMQEKGHPLLVAERDGEVAGYAYASDYRARPGYRFTCEDTIYLHPDHVGQGLGSHLLAAVITQAQDFGFKQMLGVIAAEIAGSVRLHEKHGFVVSGRYPQIGHKFDRWVDIVHMQRAL